MNKQHARQALAVVINGECSRRKIEEFISTLPASDRGKLSMSKVQLEQHLSLLENADRDRKQVAAWVLFWIMDKLKAGYSEKYTLQKIMRKGGASR